MTSALGGRRPQSSRTRRLPCLVVRTAIAAGRASPDAHPPPNGNERSTKMHHKRSSGRYRQRLHRALAWRLVWAIVASAAFSAAGDAHVPIFFASKAFGFVAGNAKLVDIQANRAYRKALRPGTCEERRERIRKMMPAALRFGRLARDIVDRGADLQQAGVETMDLGDGRTAYYEAAGHRYAEVRVDAPRNEVVIVFLGTRLSVKSDLSTDVLSLTGIRTAYYKWAAALVAQVGREHPGMQIIATGHSLGGGLVLYAVLRNPGIQGFAFNPVGLSWLTWISTSHAERTRTNAGLTVIATRNIGHIEPVTAIALARRSVLPGQLFFVETDDVSGSLALHSATTVVSGLEQLAATDAGGSSCEGVLGVLAH
jgi:hypothetical protein